jgi:5-methylcytosine-specific restriction endonuclease McrA
MRAALARRKFAAMSSEEILAIVTSPRRKYTPEAISIAVEVLNSRGKHLLLEESSFRPLITWPFVCPNCENEFEGERLFCQGRCEDEAALVRYARACIDDGRNDDPDVRDAIGKKIALLMSGYSDRDRRVPKRLRLRVIARERGACRKCGAPGTELDHISGNSSDPSNLQWLCSACHAEKTQKSFGPIPDEKCEEEMLERADVICRMWAPHPERPSDDPAIWKHLSPAIRKERRHILRERDMRRLGKHCPICLSQLQRRSLEDFRATGERRERWCARCEAGRDCDTPCPNCGAPAAWRNTTSWACQACTAFGAL